MEEPVRHCFYTIPLFSSRNSRWCAGQLLDLTHNKGLRESLKENMLFFKPKTEMEEVLTSDYLLFSDSAVSFSIKCPTGIKGRTQAL